MLYARCSLLRVVLHFILGNPNPRSALTRGPAGVGDQADQRLDDGAHTVDEDGDLVVRRKRHGHEAEEVGDEGLGVVIEHRLSTPLPDVGMQVRDSNP